MKRLFCVIGCVFLAATLSACQNMNKQDVGTLTGAAVGGLVGSQFGSGTGQIVAAVGGAIVGGFIGGQIGKSMDQTDRLQMQQALNNTRTGSSKAWSNPDTHARYRVRPTKTYKKPSGQYCREYTTSAVIAGKSQQMYGTACRQPDGSWKVISSRSAR